MFKVGSKRKYNHSDKNYHIDRDNIIYTVDNEIHFTSDINSSSIELLIKNISQAINDFYEKHNEGEKMTIKYVVTSNGGCLDSVLKFVDFLDIVRKKHSNISFESVATGCVASAGTIMCLVADKRFITKHANIMIHDLSTGYYGSYSKLQSYSESIIRSQQYIVDIYMTKYSGTRDELNKLLTHEKWFSSEEYLKYGFVDEII